MRTLRVPVLCLALSACSTIAVPTPTGGSSNPNPTTSSSASVANEVVRQTNLHRVNSGLREFTMSPQLMEAARLHAQQMAQYRRMEHTINEAPYPTLLSRLQAVSYRYSNAAENVSWNNQSAQSAVNGWMNSPGHRANILNPALTEMGAAMARGSNGEPYWIQVFGTPR